jgi:hypothetical protein
MPKTINWKIITIAALIVVIAAAALVYFQSSKSKNQTSSSNSSSQQSDATSSTSSISSSSSSSKSSAASTVSLKVFFSKNPESMNDFTYTQVVIRSTSRSDVGAYVIEQLIAGPAASEISTGLVTPLKLSGESNCGGKDFGLNIVNKVATLKFCKLIKTSGIGDDGRVKSVIRESLKQFSTIDKVVILTKDNACFGDESGLDLCKS